jgi:hypothetical protein
METTHGEQTDRSLAVRASDQEWDVVLQRVQQAFAEGGWTTANSTSGCGRR